MLARAAQAREVLCEVITYLRGVDVGTEKRGAEKQLRGHAAEGPHVQGLPETVIAQEQVRAAVLSRTYLNHPSVRLPRPKAFEYRAGQFSVPKVSEYNLEDAALWA